MTYGEIYDQMLDETYEADIDGLPSWITDGRTPARLMEENDPTMYRCGFVDFLDSLCECDRPMCERCGDRRVSTGGIEAAELDTEAECDVCLGTHVVCEDCDEVLETGNAFEIGGTGRWLCQVCYDNAKAEEEDDDADDDSSVDD